MENVMFVDCPAYLDARGTARCGLPAEVEDWYAIRSSDGPLESARIRCPRGHWFNGPLDSLRWVSPPARTCPAQDRDQAAQDRDQVRDLAASDRDRAA